MADYQTEARWFVKEFREPIIGCDRSVHYVVYDRETGQPVPLDFFHTLHQAEVQAGIYNKKGGPHDYR
jgi:hypothetical protein